MVCYDSKASLKVENTNSGLSTSSTRYVWENDESKTGQNYTTEAIDKKTTFSVKATMDGCIAEGTIEIDNFPTPEPTVDNVTGCSNSEVTLSVTNGKTYTNSDIKSIKWDGKSSLNNETYTFVPSTDGENHSVEITDANGCSATKEDITITIKELPKFEVSENRSFCIDSVVTLTATPVDKTNTYTYDWTDEDGNAIASATISGENNNTFTLPKDILKSDLKVKVSAVDQTKLNCDSSYTITVKAKENPAITTVTSVSEICKNQTATLVVSGSGEKYVWKDKSGVELSNTYSISVKVDHDTTIYVYSTLDGCTTPQEFTIKMNELPKMELENAEICYKQSHTFTTTAGLNKYKWYNETSRKDVTINDAENELTVTPDLSSNYYVVGWNANGCYDTAHASLTIHSLPVIKSSYEKTVCENGTVTVSVSDQNLTYAWNRESDGSLNYGSDLSHDYTVGEYPNVETYTIYAKTANTAGSCEDSTKITVNTKEIPQLNIAFRDTCIGSKTIMAGQNKNVRYTWYSEKDKDTPLSTASSYTTTEGLKDDQTGYYVVGTMNGCKNDSSFYVTAWSLPTIKIKGSTTVCQGNDDTLRVDNPTLGWSYKWDNGSYTVDDTTYAIYPSKATLYTLSGKDLKGCINTDQIYVALNPKPEFSVKGDKEVCVNKTSYLYATPTNTGILNYRYEWYNTHEQLIAQTDGTDAMSIKVTQDTVLVVRGYDKDQKNCYTEVEHSIKVNATPVITVSKQDMEVCDGTSAYIEVSANVDATFQWETGEDTRYINPILNLANGATQTFTVTATSTDTTQCSSSETYSVNVLELPVVTADGTTVCYGTTATLTATATSSNAGDITYRWADAKSEGAEFTTNTLTNPTTFEVEVTDGKSCTNKTTATVSIYELPVFTLSATTPICRNTETEITATSSDSRSLEYVWVDEKESNDYAAANTYTHSVGQDTTFIVWAKDEHGCRSSMKTTVKVKEYPVLSMRMESDTVCYNESRTIYVSGATNGYVWEVNGQVIKNEDGNNYTNNYYRLENVVDRQKIHVVGNSNGCTTTIDTAIKVWDLPIITIDAVAPICFGKSAELEAHGGIDGKYKWTNGAVDAKTSVIPTRSGVNTYSVTGQDIHGCKNSAEIDVTVNKLPVVAIAQDSDYVCRGYATELKAKVTSDVAVDSYQWHNEDGSMIEGAIDATFQPTIDNDSYTYWLVVKDINGCVDSATTTLKAKEFPVITHRTSTRRDSVCKGGNIIIYVSGAETYQWNQADAEGLDDSNTFSIEQLTTKQKYTVTGWKNGCSTDYDITIDTLQLPVFTVNNAVICLNDNAELKVSDNAVADRTTTLKWRHNGSSDNVIYVSPASTRDYTVTATDQYNCKTEVSANVLVRPLPTDVMIDALSSICKNDTLKLKAQSTTGREYTWYSSADTTKAENFIKKYKYTEDEQLEAVITQDTTFYLLAVNEYSCRYLTSKKISNINPPVLEKEYVDSICDGSRASLAIRGASTYRWDIDGSTKSFRTDVITQDTIFYVTGYANGCHSRDSFKVRKLELPTIGIDLATAEGAASDAICKGQDYRYMIGTGGVSGKYIWSTKQTTDTIRVAPSSSTIYRITGYGKNGCQSTADTTLIVMPLPNVSIVAVDAICNRDTFGLKAVVDDKKAIKSYAWTNFPDVTDDTLTTAITSNKNFMVTVTDTNGCYKQAEKLIQAKAYPSVSVAASPVDVCYGSTTVISAQGANAYQWEGLNASQRSFTAVITKDSTFVVEGTTDGCTTKDSVKVSVLQLPNVTIESNTGKDAICRRDSIILTAKNALTYVWSTGDTKTNIKVSPLVQTKYTAEGTDRNGCKNTAEFVLKVNPLPEFKIMGNDLVCEGMPDTLYVDYGGGKKISTYKWLSNSNVITDTFITKINENTTFIVEATDTNSCQYIAQKTVKTKSFPDVQISAVDEACYGTVANLTATGAASYVWMRQNESDTLSTSNMLNDSILKKTTYVLYGTTNGCTAEVTKTIKKINLPTVQITATSDVICIGRSTYLSGNDGLAEYIWSIGSAQQGVNVSPTSTTTYTLIGRNSRHCEARDSITIKVNQLPNVSIVGDDATCNGDQATLVGKGAATYLWTQTGETTDTIHPVITETKTFAVVGTDANGCQNSATWQVRKNDIPVITCTTPGSICLNSLASITATGANTYAWTTANDPSDTLSKSNTLNVVPKVDTKYVVTGSTNNCVAKDTVEIIVKELPNVTIKMSSDYICANDTMTLIGQGGKSYVWSTGDVTEKIEVSPFNNSTFTVTGTGENGCTDTANATVTVKPLPNFDVEGDREICKNSTAEFKAVPNNAEDEYTYNWTWTENGTEMGDTKDRVNVLVTQNTNVHVEAVDFYGCTTKRDFVIKSKAFPELTFVAPATVCQRDLLSISAFGGNNYEWSTGSKTNQMTDYPESVGTATYTLKASLNGCEKDSSVSVEVIAKPVLSISGPDAVCAGERIGLKATGALTYKWNNNVYADSLTSYPSESSTYTVIGTSENGCTETLSKMVTVNKLPDFSIISADEVCSNTDLQVMGSGDAQTYYWGINIRKYEDNISTNQSYITIPGDMIDRTLTLFVKGVDYNGCSTEKSKTIKTISTPDVFATGSGTVCIGDAVTFLGQGAETYMWERTWNQTIVHDGKDTVITMTERSNDYTYKFKPNGSDVLKLTGQLGQCATTISVPIDTLSVPSITITGDRDICAGDKVSLTANGGYKYVWSNGVTSQKLEERLKKSMRYWVVVTGYNECQSQKYVDITVHDIPPVKLTMTTMSGCPEVGTNIHLTATGAKDYIWTSDPSSYDIDGIVADHVDATIYEKTVISVTGTSEYGCEASDTITISPMDFDPMIFSVTPRVIDEKNPIITLSGDYPEKANWTWTINRSEETGWETGEDVADTIIGNYTRYKFPNTYEKDSFLVQVAATDTNGCVYHGDTYIHVWRNTWAPTAFTPNNDGVNDVFRVSGTFQENGLSEILVSDFRLIIYNRVGTIVFEGDMEHTEWDGNDKKGNPCPQGIYGYVLSYQGEIQGMHKSGETKGYITLVR